MTAPAPAAPSCAIEGPTAATAVWRSLLEASAAIGARLEAVLDDDALAGLGDLEVLVQLAAAPDGQLRMAVLASRGLLTPSGMTRRVDRLERSGLVRRESCPTDRRGAWASLTPRGRAVLAEQLPRQQRQLEEHLGRRLDRDEMAELGHLLARLSDTSP